MTASLSDSVSEIPVLVFYQSWALAVFFIFFTWFCLFIYFLYQKVAIPLKPIPCSVFLAELGTFGIFEFFH